MKRLGDWWAIYEWQIIGFLGITAFSFGTIGFFQYFRIIGEARSFWDCVYLSMQLFVLESGAISGPVPWDLNVARFLAPFVSGYTAIQALSVIFRDQIQILRLRFLNEHVIICGLGRKGLHLAREFRNRGFAVVLLEKDEENPFLETCRQERIPVMIGNARDSELLKRANVRYAKYLISLCGDDGTNAEIAMNCGRIKDPRKGPFLTVIVHIVDPLLCNLIRRQAFMGAMPERSRLEFFNVFDSASKILLDRVPLDVYFSHALILGLGRFGESLVVEAARKWRYDPSGHTSPMQITILDLQAGAAKEAMCARYPFLNEQCRFRTLEMDVDSAEYYKGAFLKPASGEDSFKSVFVCFDDDSFSLRTALTLQKWTLNLRIPIILRLTHYSGLAHLLEVPKQEAEEIQTLMPFGLVDTGCTIESVLGGVMETMAKVIHQQYVAQETRKGVTQETNPSMVPWEDLGEEMRNSNRSQADHIGKKLKAVGCDMELATESEVSPFQFTLSEIELLAELEHRRFTEERTSQGWSFEPGPKDTERKTSPYLIPYKDLPEEVKELDRNAVRSIPELLAIAGFRIIRRVKDETGTEGGAFTGGRRIPSSRGILQ